MPRTPRYWSKEEDDILRAGVEEFSQGGGSVDWCGIASRLAGRTNKDCRKRWHNAVAEGINKGQWTKSEDELLIKGVAQYGQKKWPLVAEVVKNRSADQCAKRWQQSLNPDLDRSEWASHDDKTLLEVTTKIGRHWTHIQRQHFPGRSKNAIKNRYSVITRRMQKQGITDFTGTQDMGSDRSSPKRSSTAGTSDDEDMSDEESSEPSDLTAGKTYSNSTFALPPEAGMDWASFEGQDWNLSSPTHLSDVFTTLDSTAAGSATSVEDPNSSSSSKFSSSWENETPTSAWNLPTNPFGGQEVIMPHQRNLSVSTMDFSTAETEALLNQRKVKFTLTMNEPSVNTMQLLVKVAVETQSQFRIENE